MRPFMDHRPWTMLLLLILLCGPGTGFSQLRDSLEREQVTTLEELYQDHVKEQKRKDGNMVRSGLAVTAIGVLMVIIFDDAMPGYDDASIGMAQAGLVLCIVGTAALGRGIYSILNEGSKKKRKNFFMQYGAEAKYNGLGPGPGFVAAGVTIKF